MAPKLILSSIMRWNLLIVNVYPRSPGTPFHQRSNNTTVLTLVALDCDVSSTDCDVSSFVDDTPIAGVL